MIDKIWIGSEENYPEFASEVSQALTQKNPFVLWLKGDLGAGKTTLSTYLLRALGLDTRIPVLSPTFTYMTEYNVSCGIIAHMDLYRLVEGDDDSLLSILGNKNFRGFIIEWPERISHHSFLKPTHHISMEFTPEDLKRTIRFSENLS